MSWGIYKAGAHPEIDQALSWDEVVLKFTASAAGTKHALKAPQAVAANRVYFITGNGSADLSAADAAALLARVGVEATTDQTELATGLVTYFTNLPAAADGAECFGFAVSFGGGVRDCGAVVMEKAAAASDGSNLYNQYELSANAVILNQVSLNSSNALLKDDGSTAVAATDQLVVVPAFGLVFGAITLPDAGAGVVAAGDAINLRMLVK